MRKPVSCAVTHCTVAFTVTRVVTGSFVLGGAVALIEPAVNTLGYRLHEKFWARRAVATRSRTQAGRLAASV